MPRSPAGPMAPAVLDEIEAYLVRIGRPASPAQLAERVLQLAGELRIYVRPPRDLFLQVIAAALAGADECAIRDARPGSPAGPSTRGRDATAI